MRSPAQTDQRVDSLAEFVAIVSKHPTPLWLFRGQAKAVLPPPEERRDVKTAIGAARAQKESERSR
jgi:hypothetical protein